MIFITKIEGGETKNEGLCLKCAKELGIKPVDDMMKKMGISDDDLDSISGEMMSAFGGMESLSPSEDEDDEDSDGQTATFPFLNKLFSANERRGTAASAGQQGEQGRGPEVAGKQQEKEIFGKLLPQFDRKGALWRLGPCGGTGDRDRARPSRS